MNAERLHAIVNELQQELRETRFASILENLTNSLQQLASQPTNSSSQQNLATYRDQLREALTDAPSDSFAPTWREVMAEIGADGIFGRQLLAAVESAINENQLTPTIAAEKLRGLTQKVQRFSQALDKGIDALDHFKIGSEQLSPGECEVGVLIPREAVHNRLREYVSELGDIEFIFKTLSELATGTVEDLEIRTVSSTDFMVFLQAHPVVGEIIARAIAFVVTTYKKVLEIRKLQRQIEQLNMPEEIAEGTKKVANETMEKAIDKFSVELTEEFKSVVTDKGRRNELQMSVKLSLNALANRIDKGYNFEVRIAPPTDPNTPPEVKIAAQSIQAAAPEMRFLNLEGHPILQLREPVASAEEGRGERRTTPVSVTTGKRRIKLKTPAATAPVDEK